MTFTPWNVDESEPSTTWLARVLDAPNPDKEKFYHRLGDLTAQETMDFLVDTVFPKAAEGAVINRFIRDVMTASVKRPGLKTEHVRQAFAAYLSYSMDEKFREGFAGWIQFEEPLVEMLVEADCNISTLGTACRTLEKHSSMRRSILTEHVAFSLLRARNCPIEVFARLLFYPGDGSRFEGKAYWMANFHSRVRQSHPDLVGLPEEMLLEVVASQPLPDDWFVDDWQVGEQPGWGDRQDFAYIHNGDLLWMELTEER